MKIFLIGMPGSGKSTLGKQLSHALPLPFIDLDQKIEEYEGKAISEIFANHGEDHFRIVESTLLNRFASSSESFVMATGGGAPCFFNGIEVINATGLSVFLDVPLKTLLERVKSKTDRPLLNQLDVEERLRTLYQLRIKYYERAKIKITSPDVKKILETMNLNT